MTKLLCAGQYTAKIAETPDDIQAALALRSQMFRDGACDRDHYDDRCTHVIITNLRQEVVCTFRLLLLSSGADINTSYAAQSYDAIMLIKSGVDAVGGDTANQDGIRAAMKKADFASVRGKYSYGPNHFPIQNFYLRSVKEDKDGNWYVSYEDKVLSNHQDSYYDKCKM